MALVTTDMNSSVALPTGESLIRITHYENIFFCISLRDEQFDKFFSYTDLPILIQECVQVLIVFPSHSKFYSLVAVSEIDSESTGTCTRFYLRVVTTMMSVRPLGNITCPSFDRSLVLNVVI